MSIVFDVLDGLLLTLLSLVTLTNARHLFTHRQMFERHVRVVVKGCQGLLNTDSEHLSELTDPVVAVFKDNVPNPVLITPLIINSCYPTWEESSAYADVFISDGTLLIFQVWHQNVDEKKGVFLGELRLTGDRLTELEGKIIDVLSSRPKEPNAKVKAASESETRSLGSIQIEYKPVPGEEPVDPLDATGSLILLGGLSVIEGRNLLKRDNGPEMLSDPYLTVSFRTKRRIVHRTETIPCTLNPKWAPNPQTATVVQLSAPATEPNPVLFVEAWNANPKPERDSCLGVCHIKIEDLDEGVQRLELHPRANEEDGVLKRMDGQLGWIVVEWKPVGPLAEKCRLRSESKRLGLMSGSDGIAKIAQWSPTELNEYLKRLRAGAPPEATKPVGTGAGGTTTTSALQGGLQTNSSPMPFDALTPFSPYYPHEDSNTRTSLIATASAPQHHALMAPASTNRADYEVGDPRLATVEMSDVVPIRVAYGTSFYDTQLRLDDPLSTLQAELEDVFLVHKDVQLIFHIGELKDVRVSLRRNGCLLLKGDPHIKLTMKVAKGPQRNLIFVFPDKREVALAVGESELVRAVKNQLCDEFQQERGLEELLEDPKEIRLLWRYNELNDRASLQYYNIPTNAKVNVARKPKFSFDQGKREEEAAEAHFRDEERRATSYRSSKEVKHTEHHGGGGGGYTSATSGGASKTTTKEYSYGPSTHTERKTTTVSTSGGGVGGSSARSKSADVNKRRPSPTRKPTDSQNKSSTSKPPRSSGAAESNSANQRPRGYYELDRDGTAIDDQELGFLRRTVNQLEQQVRQQTSTQGTIQQEMQERRIAKLEHDLTESENRYRDSLLRIAELESSVGRYQQLLQRATQMGLQ
ncbi:membrane-associated protein, putative [Bodo saltans]|uniref:Membrane-associated protein, putative n=1 Tax=Bodo saltans TaxID=75058 RepID=A0A0S4JBL0_BODSA|nr:membrane-associated protein, putative [Bodo saltans]|eukprot:CUG86819.1 membrane-associated protein, putative [Bodo saltans]